MPALARFRLARLACLLVATLFAAPAAGRGAGPRFGEAATPDLDRRSVDRLARTLALDDTQRVIVEGLFDDWQAAFRTGLDDLRRRIRDARPVTPSGTASDTRFARIQQAMREEMNRIMEEGRARADAAETDEERTRILTEVQTELGESRRRFDAELREFGAETGRDPAIDARTELMGREIEAWLPRKRALLAAFFGDVQAILREDQMPLWPSVERAIRRERLLSEGKLPGESIDLALLVETSVPTALERPDVKELLDAWSIRIDPLVTGRADTIARISAERDAATAAGDVEKRRRLAEREAALHARIRDVTVEIVEALLAVLPPEEAAALRTAWRGRVHPGVYRPTAAGRLINAAVLRTQAAEDDAGRQLHAAIRLIQAAHLEEDGPLADTIARETERAAEARLRDRLAGTRDDALEDRLRDLRVRRENAGRVHVDRLKELLPPDLLLSLPNVRMFLDRPASVEDARKDAEAQRRAAEDRAQRELVDRFDRDGDGVLDDEERDELLRYLRERGG